MALPTDGLVLVVKRDCPTCELIAPVAKTLQDSNRLSHVLSQDDPSFPDGLDVIDDRELEGSFGLDIEIVPTLIRRESGTETARAIGWHRGEWQTLTGDDSLGLDLPEQQPGCGSLSVAPGMNEELRVRFGDAGLKSRTVSVGYPDDEIEQMFDRGWTDGLPVVPPTPARVLRMLDGTTRPADDIIGNVPPSLTACSIEKAAVNAVMAGCRPEYFPVVIAALEAAIEPNFSWYGLLSTTMGVGPVVVVNGPVTKRIGMNWGMNVLGHGNRANSTIGRALQLISSNVGGAKPGGIDRSTLGHPGKRGVCFAEDETDETWESLATSRGIAPDTSAVTVFAGCGASVFMDQISKDAGSLAKSLASGLRGVGHPKHVQSYGAMLVLSPEHWQVFKRAGWSRSNVHEAIHDASIRPGEELVHGAGGITEGMPLQFADGDHAKFADDALVITQAGGHAGLMSVIIPGWDAGSTGTIPITKEIKS